MKAKNRARNMRKEARRKYRDKLYAEQNGLCFWCAGDMDPPTVDHVVPICKGGGNSYDNVVLSCHSCNQARGCSADGFSVTITVRG